MFTAVYHLHITASGYGHVSVTLRSQPATGPGTLDEKLSRWQGRYGAIFASPGER
jgi:hypothetical protein